MSTELADTLLEALRDIERIASARHGGELEDAVFAIRMIAASAIAKAEVSARKDGSS